MGLNAPNAEVQSPQQPITVTNQLQNIKRLLSAPITALVGDSSEIKEHLRANRIPTPGAIANQALASQQSSILPSRSE